MFSQRFPVEPGEKAEQSLELTPDSVELNQNYLLRAYLVPRGGSAKLALDEASYEAFTYPY